MAEAEGKTVPPTPTRPEGEPRPRVIVASGPTPIVAHAIESQVVVVWVTWAEAEASAGRSVAPTPATPDGPPIPKVTVPSSPKPSVAQAKAPQVVVVAVIEFPGMLVGTAEVKTGAEVGFPPPIPRPRSTVIPLPIPSVTQTSRLAPPQRVEVAVIPASSEERTLEGMSFVGTIPLVSEARMLETSEATEDASETAEVMMPVGTEVTVGKPEIRLLRALVSTEPPVEICDARDDS